METRKCAIWRRVSTAEQDLENQGVLQKWAADRGLTIVREYAITDSAWSRNNGKGREFDAARADMLNRARMGEFQVVLIWATDRLSRRGIKDTIGTLEQFHDYGCDVWSNQEQWLTTVGDSWQLVVSILAWMAQQESQRRSERMKASIATRKAAGKKVGRGHAPDKKPRKRSGYVATWEDGGAKRVSREQGELGSRTAAKKQSRRDGRFGPMTIENIYPLGNEGTQDE